MAATAEAQDVRTYGLRVAKKLGVPRIGRTGADSAVAVHEALSSGLPRRALFKAMPPGIPASMLLPVFGISLRLYPSAFSAGRQVFGQRLLSAHDFVAIPSAVSRRSWNLLFDAGRAACKYALQAQDDLDLDPRLDPPAH